MSKMILQLLSLYPISMAQLVVDLQLVGFEQASAQGPNKGVGQGSNQPRGQVASLFVPLLIVLVQAQVVVPWVIRFPLQSDMAGRKLH